MYNDTLSGSERRSSELPDAVGPTVQLQEKLYVPVKEFPDVSVLICPYDTRKTSNQVGQITGRNMGPGRGGGGGTRN